MDACLARAFKTKETTLMAGLPTPVPESDSESDISLVSTDALINEILHRCDSGVVLLKRDLTDDKTAMARRWVGDDHTVCGMCADMTWFVLRNLDAHSKKGKPPHGL